MTTAKRIRIIGREAADIARHVNSDCRYTFWTEVQVMRECKHGCKLYARRRGCVTQYELFHSKAYGCDLGRNPETSHIPVSVAPKGKPTVASDDELLNQLGSAIPSARRFDSPAAELLAARLATEVDPIPVPVPVLVDSDTAAAVIRASAAHLQLAG